MSKASHARAIRRIGDDEILHTGSNRTKHYLEVGGIPVTWNPCIALWHCLRCNVGECAHTKRAARWLETHPLPKLAGEP